MIKDLDLYTNIYLYIKMNSPFIISTTGAMSEAESLNTDDFLGVLFALKSLRDVYCLQTESVKIFLGELDDHVFMCNFDWLWPSIRCHKPLIYVQNPSFLDYDGFDKCRVYLSPSYDELQMTKIYLYVLHLYSKSEDSKWFFTELPYLLQDVDNAVLDQFSSFDNFFKLIIEKFASKVDIKKYHLPVRSIEECESSVMKLEDPNQYDVRLLKSYMRLLPVIEQTVWNTKLSGIYKFPCVTRSKKDWYDFNVSYEQLKDGVETLNNIITFLIYYQHQANDESNLVETATIAFKAWFQSRLILFDIYRSISYLQLPVFGRGGGLYNWGCFTEYNKWSEFELRDLSLSFVIDTNSLFQLKWIISVNQPVFLDLCNKILFPNVRSKLDDKVVSIIKSTSCDIDAFDEMKKLEVSRSETFDRGQLRIRELERFKFFSLFPSSSELVYLDFGGGDGEIGAAIASRLHITKNNAFVSDVKSWFGNIKESTYQNKVTYRYLNSQILPFKTEMFDLITCFQVLHHIKDYEKTLRQMLRVLKFGGVILIREHDCRNVEDSVLIDLEHSIREMVLEGKEIEYLQSYHAKYFSQGELDRILSSFGLKKIEMVYPSPKGPTRQYYAAWRKI
jgi:ubiquinone/menaquinone biosynthesis C-methylase UbiE